MRRQETEEEDDDDDDSSDSSDSDESSSPAPTTQSPADQTEAPVAETTAEPTPGPIEPTIVTDPDNTGRGDSLGGYPSDYKSIVYVEDKSYHKIPVPYKSYEYIGKSTGYDVKYDNEVEKSPQAYKAQVSRHRQSRRVTTSD